MFGLKLVKLILYGFKWVYTYIIKHYCFWCVPLPPDASWTLRKLFKLRGIGQDLMRWEVGNGQSVFLWLDHWQALGPLYEKYGESVVHNLGRSLFAKVASIIHEGTWKWPRQRNAVSREIIFHYSSYLDS